MTRLFLVSNSPGEVSTFVKPMLEVLRRRHPDWHLQVCLVPCPYATGAEAEVIRSWPEAPEVWTPWQTTRAWLSAEGRGEPGVVLFLGGDPWHALLLKQRFKLPCLAYFPQESAWQKTSFLGGFDRVARGYGQGLGDLRVDSTLKQLTDCVAQQADSLTLALFPGSRWLHLKAGLGPFLRAIDLTVAQHPDLKVLLAASPFITRESLQDAAAHPLKLGLAYSTAVLQGDFLLTEAGSRVEIVWGRPYEVMTRCHLALSLPGTNTAELAIAGKATVVPLSSRVPVGGGGLLGILDRLPGLASFKRKLRESKKRRISLVALPNQLAGRMVIPEFMVRDDLSDLGEYLAELLADPERCRQMGQEARDVMGPRGASERLAEQIESLL